MRGWAVALISVELFAQPPQSVTVRGILLERVAAASGDISVRVNDNHVYCFRFDAATTVERDGVQAGLMDLRKGDTVEVVTGAGPNPRLQRATLIRVVVERPALPPLRARWHPSYGVLDELYPRGNLTCAGVVTGVTPGRVVLQTRTEGEREVLLRQDTRFVHDGHEVAASALSINSRVFVRGARNLDGDFEAYQVMWGDILRPR